MAEMKNSDGWTLCSAGSVSEIVEVLEATLEQFRKIAWIWKGMKDDE